MQSPLEATCDAVLAEIGDGDVTLAASRAFALRIARASIRALAENISDEMVERAARGVFDHYMNNSDGDSEEVAASWAYWRNDCVGIARASLLAALTEDK